MIEEKNLRLVPVTQVDPNPENPRIVFRPEEMDALLISVQRIGIQVPVSLYRDKGRFVLIDGERRWRVAKKLNLRTIPAIVQEKPTPLQNLLMMFNIHALREQWDTFTIAHKLTRVIALLESELERAPTETEISEHTGLSRGTIRRCKLLIELPERFKDILLGELNKPKSKQKFTEDFFIEMEQSLKTVRRNYPEFTEGLDDIRDGLIKKFGNEVIKSVTDFRMLAKIATASKNLEYPVERAKQAIGSIFFDPKSGIEEVFNSTVATMYDERRLVSYLNNLVFYLSNLKEEEKKDEELRKVLIEVRNQIDQILPKEV